MGRMAAVDMIEQEMVFGKGDIDTVLSWHLTRNHYPPVPSSMIEPCKKAIELANDGEWDGMVELPEGVTYRGDTHAPVRAMIEQHHLGDFLSGSDDD